MYARLHIWKQIEVFSFHWYYKTYKLENEFASVYPLMLFAEFDANKTCRAGVGREWESKHWLNNIDTALKHLLQPFFQNKIYLSWKMIYIFSSERKDCFSKWNTIYSHIPLQCASCCWGASWPWAWGCRPSPRTRMFRPGSRSCPRLRRGLRWSPQRGALESNKYLDTAARCYSDTNGHEWRLIYLQSNVIYTT